MFWHEDIGFRPVSEEDLEQVRQLRNEPSTWMFLTVIGQISQDQQKSWFEKVDKANDCAYFSIFKEVKNFPVSYEGDFLGIIRFDQLDDRNRSVRVGADIVPEERGKGYGTKAMEAILKFCFDHMAMHRLWLCVLDENTVAKKLYKNTGFKEEGMYREAVWRDGKWHNYVVMSVLEDEYRQ